MFVWFDVSREKLLGKMALKNVGYYCVGDGGFLRLREGTLVEWLDWLLERGEEWQGGSLRERVIGIVQMGGGFHYSDRPMGTMTVVGRSRAG